MVPPPPSPVKESPIPEVTPTGFFDPHNLAPVVEQMGFQARRASKVALMAATSVLGDHEVVELGVKGRFLGRDGVCLLTSERLLLVNDNEWKPDVAEVEVNDALTVQGWADDRSAAIVFTGGGGQVVIERISEKDAAQALAEGVRARISA